MLLSERTEVLTTHDPDRWTDILEEIGSYDTYHLPAYHRLAEIRGEGRASMLVYRDASCVIAFPMLIRPIEALGDGHADATSVYGYPGPVASSCDVLPQTKERFAQVLQDFLRQSNIVCAFTRLNPVLDNAHILRGCGEILDIGPTVSIDLALPSDVQYARYRRSHKHDVSQLKDRGFTCSEAGKEALNGFLRAYHETMARNNADDYYYFDRTYFEYLLDELPEAHLFVCRDGDTIVSGMIALACNGVVQGHLGGSLDRYVRLAPMKLAYDAVRRWANNVGAHTFHLGGGIGGRHDSLLQFKRGFGQQRHVFSVWRHYADARLCQDIYCEMCRASGIVPEDDSYFPPYRNPVFHSAKAPLA